MAVARLIDVEPATSAVAAPLVLSGISKRWPRAEHPVLDHIDLVVEPGTAVAIGGRNGAGKTTLLRVAAGLIAPDAGRVAIAGCDPERSRRDFHRRVGFLSAGNGALYARLTVDDHLELWARLALLGRPARRDAAARMRATFELDELRGRRVDRLSTGQRQRLRLSGAFLHEPDVVLLDEPESSLDDEATALVANAADSVRGRGGAVVVCSPASAQSLTFDRRYVVAGGQLIEEPA